MYQFHAWLTDSFQFLLDDSQHFQVCTSLRSFSGAWLSIFHDNIAKPVDKLLSFLMEHNLAVIVITQRPTQLLVSHISLVFSLTPQFGCKLGVDEPKSSFLSGNPANTVVFVRVQKLLEEFPKHNLFSHWKHEKMVF